MHSLIARLTSFSAMIPHEDDLENNSNKSTEYKGGKGKERQERRSTKRLCSTAYVSLKGNAKTDYTGEGVTERQLTITYDNSADLNVAQKTFVIMLIYSLKSN